MPAQEKPEPTKFVETIKPLDWLRPFCWLDTHQHFGESTTALNKIVEEGDIELPIMFNVPENRTLGIHFHYCYRLENSESDAYISGIEARNITAENEGGLVLIALLPKRAIIARFGLNGDMVVC